MSHWRTCSTLPSEFICFCASAGAPHNEHSRLVPSDKRKPASSIPWKTIYVCRHELTRLIEPS
jgi:hypothetical protein